MKKNEPKLTRSLMEPIEPAHTQSAVLLHNQSGHTPRQAQIENHPGIVLPQSASDTARAHSSLTRPDDSLQHNTHSSDDDDGSSPQDHSNQTPHDHDSSDSHAPAHQPGIDLPPSASDTARAHSSLTRPDDADPLTGLSNNTSMPNGPMPPFSAAEQAFNDGLQPPLHDQAGNGLDRTGVFETLFELLPMPFSDAFPALEHRPADLRDHLSQSRHSALTIGDHSSLGNVLVHQPWVM